MVCMDALRLARDMLAAKGASAGERGSVWCANARAVATVVVRLFGKDLLSAYAAVGARGAGMQCHSL